MAAEPRVETMETLKRKHQVGKSMSPVAEVKRSCPGGGTPFPDYPSKACSFIHLDAKLLPYWHLLFDVCPAPAALGGPLRRARARFHAGSGWKRFRRFSKVTNSRTPASRAAASVRA